jgi:hypothetical protein
LLSQSSYLAIEPGSPDGKTATMQNFVGWTFFLLLFVGVGFALFGRRMPQNPGQCTHPQAIGLMIGGSACLWFAVLNGYFELNSPRPTMTGTIGGLSQKHGNRSSSSDFVVVGDDDQRVAIHCHYAGTGLQMGERIRVRYIQYNHNLLEAEILSGSVSGWHFAESDGRWLYGCMAMLGLALLFAGYRALRRLARSEAV